MDGPTAPRSPRRRAAERAAIVAALLTTCLWPWGKHLFREASLLGDDTQRIEDLQLRPLSALLFRPFNEHLAPLFETASWVAWQGAGRQLSAAPLAFTAMSYLPFLLLLLAAGSLARRIAGSWAAAGLTVALLALTPAYAEVVFWYSASSFAWALLFTCLAMEAADRAREPGRGRWAIAAGLLAFLAPCWSGVGLLAGPSGMIAGWPGRWRRRDLSPSLAVGLGTAAYLVMAFLARQHAIIGASVEKTTRLGESAGWMARAPLYLLASGPLARRRVEDWPVAAGAVGLTLASIAVAIWFARGGPRRLIGAASALVVGGYLLTYPFRVETFPGKGILLAGRYHAFPMLGLALLIAAALKPALARWERSRSGGATAAVFGLALVLLLANRDAIRERSSWHKFSEQAATLRGLDRLAEVCRDRGITREQAIAGLDPVLARWNNAAFNTLRLLPLTATSSRVADSAVRPTILASLTAEERREVFAGTDVTRRMVAGPAWEGGAGPPSTATLVDQLRMHPTGEPGRFRHDGWPSYLEYAFPGEEPPSAIRIPSLADSEEVQLWWPGPSGRWSAERSLTLAPKAAGRGLADVVLPLASIPHWEPGEARRVRIFFCRKGEVALAAPESVRGRLR